MLTTQLEPEVYNVLDDVMVAHARLQKLDRIKILERLSAVILKYEVEDCFGIRLLHNHNKVREDEVMLEQEEVDSDGIDCLSTVATPRLQMQVATHPNTWKLCGDTFTPLEYSLDEKVSLEHVSQDRLSAFLKAFAEALRANQSEDLLGLCVIPRGFYERCKPVGDSMLVETTDDVRRANVVRFVEASRYSQLNVVEATWVAQREVDTTGATVACTTRCLSNCQPHTACVIEDGEHKSKTAHSKLHTEQHG